MWFFFYGGVILRPGMRDRLVLRGAMVAVASVVAVSILGSIDLADAGSVTLTSICDIQGGGLGSDFDGETVQTQGVVFADLDETARRGFFMQTADCDADPQTSDGIFVYLGESGEFVTSGDLVEVTGEVQEYYGLTEIDASPVNIIPIASGNPLPSPVELTPPFDRYSAARYYESLEGMYVAMDEAAVVGPTVDETWVVRADLDIARVFQDDLSGTGEILCVDDGALYQITPEARVGDHVLGLEGVLDYSFGEYRLQLISAPVLVPGTIPSDDPLGHGIRIDSRQASYDFSVATFNLENLFDTYDDPTTEDTVLSMAEYQRRIKKRALAIHVHLREPAILIVQEAENLDVLLHLVSRPEIEADYGIVWENGPDFRGIDIALLYRKDIVELLGYQQFQGCTTLLDGLGPDGNRDVDNPYNAVTCDTNDDGEQDGNRLFSRPPLVVQLSVCAIDCQADLPEDREPVQLTVVVNHWKSKLQDSDTIQYTLPRRMEQAQFVSGLLQEIRSEKTTPYIIVLGDLNDYPDSVPLSILKDAGLRDLTVHVSKPQRYTFIHRGVSQVLDYILVSLSPGLASTAIAATHINADYPAVFAGVDDSVYRCSDHDPLVANIKQLNHFSFLPLVSIR